MPNPAASPTPGTPIVSLNTGEQLYKGIQGDKRVFWDGHGKMMSEDEFKKLHPSGYTEGKATNSHMEERQGGLIGSTASVVVPDQFSGGPSQVKSGAAGLAQSIAALKATPTMPTPPPPPTPTKASDLSGGIGEGNPILDGLSSALQYRKPYLG